MWLMGKMNRIQRMARIVACCGCTTVLYSHLVACMILVQTVRLDRRFDWTLNRGQGVTLFFLGGSARAPVKCPIEPSVQSDRLNELLFSNFSRDPQKRQRFAEPSIPSLTTEMESILTPIHQDGPEFRRNLSLAACQPCRKAKTGCDHAKPCSRCIRRGLQHQWCVRASRSDTFYLLKYP
jgi:hypothetical protein